MNRAYRRLLAKKGKGEQFAERLIQVSSEDANAKATNNTLVLAAEVLHQKFGFGKDRINLFLMSCAKEAECVKSKMVTMAEIRDQIAKECKWPAFGKVKV